MKIFLAGSGGGRGARQHGVSETELRLITMEARRLLSYGAGKQRELERSLDLHREYARLRATGMPPIRWTASRGGPS
jgi:hypothetical protein